MSASRWQITRVYKMLVFMMMDLAFGEISSLPIESRVMILSTVNQMHDLFTDSLKGKRETNSSLSPTVLDKADVPSRSNQPEPLCTESREKILWESRATSDRTFLVPKIEKASALLINSYTGFIKLDDINLAHINEWDTYIDVIFFYEN